MDLALLTVSALVFVALVTLGTWQLHRLEWKTNLIAAVDARAFGDPVPPPAQDVSEDEHAFLRVAVTGTYRHDLSRRVKAVTELGPGLWLMTPLKRDRGHVWINRGFIPQGMEVDELAAPGGTVGVEGLLRITEPDGTLIESNDPAQGRWVSRDTAALSRDVGLEDFELYFIDADHSGAQDAWPRGGLTVIRFRNPHLAYALTWFIMAAMFLAGIAYVVWDRLRGGSG
ncbi:MAG: SURF1 family protein [Pseudomonadota bacterium]